MAENEEKKADAKKDEKAADPTAKVEKKNKLVLFAGIGGVLLVALGVGGFFIFKTISGKKHVEMAAQGTGHEANADPHAKPEADPHAKPDEHGAANDKKEEKKDDHKKDEGKKDEPKKDEGKKDEPKKDEGKKDEPKKDEPKKDDHGAPAANGAKKEEPKGTANFGDTFLIPRMDLNLGNSIENRFIRIGVAIEYRGGEMQGFELKKREVQLKDIVITAVTTKTRIVLISEEGKENLRREILNRINEVTDRPVQNVYFTEFFVE
ncbi:flagellar basal body-associated FliL family protein [Silvanigrella aquatica]|uniref:Flagellar protein FliL n=1 Tax=Silvanigrella aquatica TaxID=1915309 RepID=A0A1L4CXP3_9BACT|nr:flagellar basal body-associated FliL family protein [Silvanigrella aquatica]APJ02715.1 hypothetical protein AXG55_01730 [Silvanigrella aquatica]